MCEGAVTSGGAKFFLGEQFINEFSCKFEGVWTLKAYFEEHKDK